MGVTALRAEASAHLSAAQQSQALMNVFTVSHGYYEVHLKATNVALTKYEECTKAANALVALMSETIHDQA